MQRSEIFEGNLLRENEKKIPTMIWKNVKIFNRIQSGHNQMLGYCEVSFESFSQNNYYKGSVFFKEYLPFDH